MTVVPVFYPASDGEFRDTTRRVLEAGAWDFESDEAIALLQAVLQTHYPMATVVADRSSDSGRAARTVLGVYRDGTASIAGSTVAWLSAVYDLAGPPAYRVTRRLLGDTRRAEAVVEQAFAELPRDNQVATVTAARSVYASAFRLARNQLRAEKGLAPVEVSGARREAVARPEGIRTPDRLIRSR